MARSGRIDARPTPAGSCAFRRRTGATRTTFPPGRHGAPWRRRRALLLPAALSGAVASPGTPASAARVEAVDLLLVLAVDASGGIDADEFRLQREGCAGALVHPAVLAAVTSQPLGAIGVALVEWGSPGGAATVVDWHRVDGAASAERLARAVLDAPRSPQSWNALGDAVDHAAGLIAAAPWRAGRRVIDVSGDGPDMRGLRPIQIARPPLHVRMRHHTASPPDGRNAQTQPYH